MIMAAGGVIALVYVLFAASSKPGPDGFGRFSQGAMQKLEVAPDAPVQPQTILRDASGRATTLAAYRGKVILVNLWATWCAPCVTEMPTLGALARRFRGSDFLVVPVSLDEEAKIAEASAMLDRLSERSLPFLNDPSRAIAFETRAAGLPTSILYDRNGVEIARLAGGADWDSEEAAAMIEAALAGE